MVACALVPHRAIGNYQRTEGFVGERACGSAGDYLFNARRTKLVNLVGRTRRTEKTRRKRNFNAVYINFVYGQVDCT